MCINIRAVQAALKAAFCRFMYLYAKWQNHIFYRQHPSVNYILATGFWRFKNQFNYSAG